MKQPDLETAPTSLLAVPPRLSELGIDRDFAAIATVRGRAVDPAAKTGRFDGFPRVGEYVENCRLVAELGRGATGLVFLAEQEALAGRPIVLKVATGNARGEHLHLARLQHTHVMPLYWAATLPYEGWQVLAMPYLARTTLSGLVFRLDTTREPRSGARAADELEADAAALPVPPAGTEHGAAALRTLTWEGFVVRLGRVLAETLAFVHRRNLVHLDLKPSNVLVAPDGQPILLDLDIACPPVPAGTTSLPWIGGTSEYMSPEQRAAVAALRAGRPTATPLDGRSDQYSLALVLFSALGGTWAEDAPPDPAALPGVSPGLAAILARCLRPDPADRYPDGHALAEDLARHERSEPLKGVRNSLGERWRKWRARRPLGLPLALLLAGFCAAAAVAGWNLFRADEDARRQAEAALLDGQNWQRKGDHEAAIRRFLAGKELAEQTQGGGPLVAEFDARLRQTRRMQKAGELAETVHLMRFHALAGQPPRRLQWVLDTAGKRLWADRELLLDTSAGALEPAAEKAVRDQLQEMALLWVDLHAAITPAEHRAAGVAEAQAVLAEGDRVFGPTLALALARERLATRPPGSRSRRPPGSSAPSAGRRWPPATSRPPTTRCSGR